MSPLSVRAESSNPPKPCKHYQVEIIAPESQIVHNVKLLYNSKFMVYNFVIFDLVIMKVFESEHTSTWQNKQFFNVSSFIKWKMSLASTLEKIILWASTTFVNVI